MYRAQKEAVQAVELKVQQLALTFSITGNATPASKTIAVDDPAVLFIKSEGLSQVTAAAGALDSGEATPSFDLTATDSTGQINFLVKVGEQIKKVVSAQVVNRASGVSEPCYPNASGLSVSANGDKILLNCNTASDLSAANVTACLIIRYIV